jgi:hypothetical protein
MACVHNYITVTAATTEDPAPYRKCSKCGDVRPGAQALEMDDPRVRSYVLGYDGPADVTALR